MDDDSSRSTPQIVSRADWTIARKALLAEEKALTKARDALAEKRRRLPMVKVTQDYRFSATSGPVTLSELFGECTQLIVYHFMFGPNAEAGCPSCSLIADSYANLPVHLRARNVAFVTVSRAPIDRVSAFQSRMGWTFDWVSSLGSTFNTDFGVTFSEEDLALGLYNYETASFPVTEAPGLSVFMKDQDGTVFHTYSTYSRGLDHLIGVYPLLDLVPKGRDESVLPMSMAWIRHHDRYVG